MNKTKVLGLAVALTAFLLAAVPASATSYAGHPVKGSGPAVYYVTKSNERLVFPDEATFKSWYSGFAEVIRVQDWELQQLPLAGSVAMKPGVKMIRAKGDNRVYAVARYGVARWISTPSAARVIYGNDWWKSVAEVSPATLAEYVPGGVIAGPDQYWWMRERDSVKSIDDNYEPTMNGTRRLAGASVVDSAELTVKAIVINGNDGRFPASDSDMLLFIESLPVRSGKAYKIKPGSYTLYRTEVPGFVMSDWGGDCLPGGTVGLKAGQKKTCSVTYTYSPEAAKEPTLTVSVNVINDYDGKLMPDDFTLFVGSDFVHSGSAHQYAPGTYRLTVSSQPTTSQSLYTPLGWSGDCNQDGTIELKRGRTYSCAFTYDDVAPHAFQPTMGQVVLNAIIKGGTAKLSYVRLFIEGKQVQPGQLNDVDPRDYTVYKSDIAGYTASAWQGDCSPEGYVKGEVMKLKTCVVVYTKN